MKKILLFCFINTCNSILLPAGITYEFSGGRFGDNIIAYSKAKFISFKFNLPFIYKSFPHSDQLTMHIKEKNNHNYYPTNICLHNISHLPQNNMDTLIISRINTIIREQSQSIKIIDIEPTNPRWECFWIDEIYEKIHEYPEFGKQLKNMLTPINPPAPPSFPSDHISVAVHIRKGKGHGYDFPIISTQIYDINNLSDKITHRGFVAADSVWPLRFVPEQFYIDQIKKLSNLLNHPELFIQIFTDDPLPQQLVQRIQSHCKLDNLHISLGNIRGDTGIIEDIYAMSHFDCLIRPSSHFSGVAQFLGNHKLIIRPESAYWQNGTLIINKTAIIIFNKNANTLVKRVFDLEQKKELLALVTQTF